MSVSQAINCLKFPLGYTFLINFIYFFKNFFFFFSAPYFIKGEEKYTKGKAELATYSLATVEKLDSRIWSLITDLNRISF